MLLIFLHTFIAAYSHTYMTTRHKQGGHVCMTVCIVRMETSSAGSMPASRIDGQKYANMYVMDVGMYVMCIICLCMYECMYVCV